MTCCARPRPWTRATQRHLSSRTRDPRDFRPGRLSSGPRWKPEDDGRSRKQCRQEPLRRLRSVSEASPAAGASGQRKVSQEQCGEALQAVCYDDALRTRCAIVPSRHGRFDDPGVIPTSSFLSESFSSLLRARTYGGRRLDPECSFPLQRMGQIRRQPPLPSSGRRNCEHSAILWRDFRPRRKTSTFWSTTCPR